MVVLIALADIGPAMPLEDQLVASGLAARWDPTQTDGPRGDGGAAVVLIDADHLGPRLREVANAWRNHASIPGIVAIGMSADARDHAQAARVVLLAPTATVATIVAAIREAARLRLASDMRWIVLRAAVGLPPVADSADAWQPTLVAARAIDIEIPRGALRWHAQHYATSTPRLDELREHRILTVPELEAVRAIDGTTTVQTLVKAGPLDPLQAARLLWALVSLAAVDLTPEVRDVTTSPRRLLAELRGHLRARAVRLANSTYYDVLEVTPLSNQAEMDAAYRLVGMRYGPEALAGHDFAGLAGNAKAMWDVVEKARSVLVDHAACGRYHDWLRQRGNELRSVWAIEPAAVQAAAEAFARGQRALGAGDVHKAMSELAGACRQFPGHPDYEANLAWARYRVQVQSGRDRLEAAIAERATIENVLLGCRPWPRALVPLALLCAAADDPDSARWHLHTALTVDPNVPAAAQLAQRLGMRRP